MLGHACVAAGAGAQELLFALGEALSVRAYLGWTTGGHTAVDVNLYGYTSQSSIAEADLTPLRGNHDNTEIGEFIRDYLQLDLDAITAELRYGAPPAAPTHLANGPFLTTLPGTVSPGALWRQGGRTVAGPGRRCPSQHPRDEPRRLPPSWPPPPPALSLTPAM